MVADVALMRWHVRSTPDTVAERMLDARCRLAGCLLAVRADQHRIQSAPYPASYCKVQMRQQVEQLAERGEPSLARLVELDEPIDFPTTRITSEIHTERPALGFTEVPDALALFAWLHRYALIAKLDKLIGEEADTRPRCRMKHGRRPRPK